ncbi:MAG: deoxynucleoside kinase [Bacteroidetes bacterium]|jgi:deoxyadenosine/deoxycytidine kinase|nr:deoxynucleoside kinase [Bacteroidota bacterium]MCC7514801.1 deoxynucleoside kinase [Bacteroidia bacterium]MCW5920428.1 deoxynucleoside kinase [Bacteroidota bacterium]HNC33714.1 deoxynucleoside kinase [Bacteroidia bacterium]HQO87238.1 deoxynucleoside kinase [Bacteroidia bacterium]
MHRNKFLTIEGNIGAGKTSLARMIADEFNFQLILEEFAENTFLQQFYESPEKFAFPLEMSFMAARYKQLKTFFNKNTLPFPIVSDYMFQKTLLFAKSNLKNNEYGLFEQFFQMLNVGLPLPQLIVYLQKEIPSLQKNIKKRGRDYEQNMKDDYLLKINNAYGRFMKRAQKSSNILIINTEGLDFVRKRSDFQKILETIEKAGFRF